LIRLKNKVKGKIWTTNCKRVSISLPTSIIEKVVETWKKKQREALNSGQTISRSSVYAELLLLALSQYEIQKL